VKKLEEECRLGYQALADLAKKDSEFDRLEAFCAEKDAKIAEQAAEIQALVNRQAAKDEEIERWERKEIKRACDCHGQEQRAVKAERERDEARKALVWVEDNIQSIDLKEPVEEPLEKWRKE
jgi:hypothetical protein